jgi:hypothetical protein
MTVLLAALLAPLPLGATDEGAIAIVYGLKGQAFVRAAPRAPRLSVERFQWLRAGAELQVAPGGTLQLAFSTGARYELGGGAKAVLSAPQGFKTSSGPVRALPAVSPLPRLASLSTDVAPGVRAGAVRLRGRRIAGLYPRDDASVLPNEATLSFEPLPGAASYKVQVEDEAGKVVFDEEVGAPTLTLPPDVLKAGGRYHWTVRSLAGAASVRGDADFSVPSPESLAAREALRRSLEGQDDADSLALLAEVDGRLGLVREAQRGFEAALAKTPSDATLQTALQGLERRISASGREPEP